MRYRCGYVAVDDHFRVEFLDFHLDLVDSSGDGLKLFDDGPASPQPVCFIVERVTRFREIITEQPQVTIVTRLTVFDVMCRAGDTGP